MKRKNLIALALLIFCFGSTLTAQSSLGHLRSWAGKYPTNRRGRVTTSFFKLPEIRRPLLSLLSRADFNLLTRDYQVETPIKQIGNYLAVKVCLQHACDTDNAAFAINLDSGFIYVKIYADQQSRWFGSKGTYTDLPRSVLDFLNDFSAT
jgi:hypothetical protein